MNRGTPNYKSLGQLCTKITDGTHQTPVYQDKGVVFISAKNVKDGQLDFTDKKYISQQEHNFLTKSNKPTAGDLLLTKSGSLGDAAVIPELDFGFSIFESLALLKPKRELVTSNYLHQYIRSPHAARYFQSITTGLAVKHLHLGDLRKLKVFLPPLRRQEEIAMQLSTWDSAIEKAEQIIAEKEQRHAGLLQLLITSIPARHHWATIEFGSVVTERTQRTTTHDQHPVLTSSRRGLLLQSEYFSRQVTSENNTAYKVMRHGDFTFRSMSDDGRFVFNRLTTLDAGVISPAYGVFYAKDCYPKFLAHFLNSSYFANVLNRESQGGTRKALRFSSIAKVETDFPSLSEQKRIAIILDASREEIEIEIQRQTLLREQKRGLMQKLLTGQWRVKAAETEAR